MCGYQLQVEWPRLAPATVLWHLLNRSGPALVNFSLFNPKFIVYNGYMLHIGSVNASTTYTINLSLLKVLGTNQFNLYEEYMRTIFSAEVIDWRMFYRYLKQKLK